MADPACLCSGLPYFRAQQLPVTVSAVGPAQAGSGCRRESFEVVSHLSFWVLIWGKGFYFKTREHTRPHTANSLLLLCLFSSSCPRLQALDVSQGWAWKGAERIQALSRVHGATCFLANNSMVGLQSTSAGTLRWMACRTHLALQTLWWSE